jgi:hypothetical protein
MEAGFSSKNMGGSCFVGLVRLVSGLSLESVTAAVSGDNEDNGLKFGGGEIVFASTTEGDDNVGKANRSGSGLLGLFDVGVVVADLIVFDSIIDDIVVEISNGFGIFSV